MQSKLEKLNAAASAARQAHHETKLRYAVYKASDAELWAAWQACADALDALSRAKQAA